MTGACEPQNDTHRYHVCPLICFPGSLTKPTPLRFNQGWPKLAGNVVLESPADGGIGIGVFAPVSAVFPPGRSVPAGTRVDVNTRYPFRDAVEIVVAVPEGAAAEVPLHVRIPGWASHATMQVRRPFQLWPSP